MQFTLVFRIFYVLLRRNNSKTAIGYEKTHYNNVRNMLLYTVVCTGQRGEGILQDDKTRHPPYGKT